MQKGSRIAGFPACVHIAQQHVPQVKGKKLRPQSGNALKPVSHLREVTKHFAGLRPYAVWH